MNDLEHAIEAVAIAVLTGAALIGLPALWKWFAARLDNATKREAQDITQDSKEEQLDLETRDIANKLALTALDKEQQLQRLKAEYSAQTELVKTQASEIMRLTETLTEVRGERDTARKELTIERAEKQELLERLNSLINELGNAAAYIKQLEIEIAILETTK